jgi:protein TonB
MICGMGHQKLRSQRREVGGKAMKLILAVMALLVPGMTRALPVPQDAGASRQEEPVTRIKVGGNVTTSKLIERVQPVYPPLARQTRIQGTVRLHVILGKDGLVKQLEVISGHPLLVQSALDAVKKWRYAPTLLNGEPVEVDTTVDVIYALNQDAPAAPPASQVDPQLRADILRLLEVTHFKDRTAESGQKLFEPMRPILTASLPNTANRDKIVDSYIAKLLALLQSDDFTEQVVTIYARYFSDQDVKAITEFYGTPTGQHFNEVMGDFLGDMSKAGQRAAMENIPDIMKQLCKEFPELESAPNTCPDASPEKKSELLPLPRNPLQQGETVRAGSGN